MEKNRLKNRPWSHSIYQALEGVHCPLCQSGEVALILYGQRKSDPELDQLILQKKVILWGSCFGVENHFCFGCHASWAAKEKIEWRPVDPLTRADGKAPCQTEFPMGARMPAPTLPAQVKDFICSRCLERAPVKYIRWNLFHGAICLKCVGTLRQIKKYLG